jgi:hypothetical protein
MFSKLASANLREKDDSWNTAIGGFLAGSVLGLRCQLAVGGSVRNSADMKTVRTVPSVLGYGAGLAIILGTFDYTGGVLTGYERDPNVDEYDRKEQLRKNRRRPIQETIEELGEGRGTSFVISSLLLGAAYMTFRHLRTRIRREKTRKNPAKIWN